MLLNLPGLQLTVSVFTIKYKFIFFITQFALKILPVIKSEK